MKVAESDAVLKSMTERVNRFIGISSMISLTPYFLTIACNFSKSARKSWSSQFLLSKSAKASSKASAISLRSSYLFSFSLILFQHSLVCYTLILVCDPSDSALGFLACCLFRHRGSFLIRLGSNSKAFFAIAKTCDFPEQYLISYWCRRSNILSRNKTSISSSYKIWAKCLPSPPKIDPSTSSHTSSKRARFLTINPPSLSRSSQSSSTLLFKKDRSILLLSFLAIYFLKNSSP